MKPALPLVALAKWGSIKLLLLSIIFAFCFALSAFFSPSHAQEEYPSTDTDYVKYTSQNAFNTNPDIELNTHNGVQILVIEILSAGICQLAGFDPTSPNGKCLGVEPKTGKIGYVENGGGAIAVVGKLIDYTFVPPVSSTQYFAHMKDKFGLVKDAHAQERNPCIRTGAQSPTTPNDRSRGTGFCSLLPILPLWTSMRNIVYLILILVFVIIGLGIMLRVHIDPRTVMTLQNQIPKIIIGIVAITFSFAISGLLIDVMWVAIYLFAGVLLSATTEGSLPSNVMDTVLTAGTPFVAAESAVEGGIWNLAQNIAKAFSDVVEQAISDVGLGLIQNAVGGLIDFLGAILLFIAILIVLIRLWIMLVITYINVVLDVIFAPFWILAGLIPGSSLGVGAWLRDLIANLAVFPMAISFLLLGSYFMKAFEEADTTTRLLPPLLGGTEPTFVAGLIAFGFIFMLPNVLNTVKAALKAPKISFGPLFGPVGASAGIFANTAKGIAQNRTMAREFHVTKFNEETGQVSYGRVGARKAFFRRLVG